MKQKSLSERKAANSSTYFNLFTDAMQQKGGVLSGRIYCGVYNGMPFKLEYHDLRAAHAVNFFIDLRFAQQINKAFTKALKTAIKKDTIKLITPKVNGNHFRAQISVGVVAQLSAEIDRLMQIIEREARTFGYTSPSTCAICGQSGVDAYALHGNAYTTVHRHCAEAEVNTKSAKIQDNQQNGSYFSGIIGVILGGIVGTLPSVFAAVFLNIISAWLCALIPLAAYWGYKLFKGKMNSFATVASLIVSVAMIPVMDYFIESFMYYANYGFLLSINEYIELFFSYQNEFITAYIQSFVFVVIGMVVIFQQIRKGNKQFLEEVSFIGSTIQPMHANEPYPSAYPTVHETEHV